MREHVSRTNSAVRTTVACRAAGSVTMTMTVAITQMRRSAVCISFSTDNDLCVPASCLHTWDCMYASYWRESSGLLLLWPSHMSVGGVVGICPMSWLTHVAHWCISLHVVSILHFTLTHWLDSEVGLSSLQTTYLFLAPFSFSSLLISPWFHSCLWQKNPIAASAP